MRSDIRYWLRNPESKPEGSSEYKKEQATIKDRALKKYHLIDGQIYRKPESIQRKGKNVCNLELNQIFSTN